MNPDIFNNLTEMLNRSKTANNTYDSSNFDFLKNLNNSFSFNNNTTNRNEDSAFDFSNIDMETILKLKNIMNRLGSNQSSPRSNLLKALKPYLKDSKKEKVDQYIQLMNMASIFEELNNNNNYSGKG